MSNYKSLAPCTTFHKCFFSFIKPCSHFPFFSKTRILCTTICAVRPTHMHSPVHSTSWLVIKMSARCKFRICYHIDVQTWERITLAKNRSRLHIHSMYFEIHVSLLFFKLLLHRLYDPCSLSLAQRRTVVFTKASFALAASHFFT